MIVEFLLIGFILFFAAFAQGMTGFGFAMFSLSLLSFLMDINQAVPLAAMCGLVINLYLISRLKTHLDFTQIKNLIIGAVIGIPVGTYVLSIASPQVLKILLGIVILFFIFLSVAKFIKQTGINKKWGYLFGFLSGILGGALNTDGPPVLIYFYLQGFDKLKQKASITGFFIFTSIMVVTTHAVTGVTTRPIFMNFLTHLPFVIVGLLLGNYCFYKISGGFYNKIILGFLFILSLFMIFG
ncbi:MAG: hypothetical protein A2068_10270 [Ignavibacteria bacterium GWB2_35_6b]|nr:MAG: hypothetical protein A2068_10270 [Ignavibacteria bacterium GWB2_35_6b]